MASLLDAATLATDVTFCARVKAAAQRVAVDQGTAILGSGETPSPVAKQLYQLYQKILTDPDGYGLRFAWALATLSYMDSAADDDTLSTAVSNVCNILANLPLG